MNGTNLLQYQTPIEHVRSIWIRDHCHFSNQLYHLEKVFPNSNPLVLIDSIMSKTKQELECMTICAGCGATIVKGTQINSIAHNNPVAFCKLDCIF